MQRTLVLAAVAALALAPAASAKEITKAEVCGADGCSAAAAADRPTLSNGGASRTAPAAAPFYVVRLAVDGGGGHRERWETTAVPARRALRAPDGTWIDMPSDVAAVITKLTANHRPFPASGLTGAAPPPKPHPAPAAGSGSPLWPEAALIALVLAVGAVVLGRGARRFRPASG